MNSKINQNWPNLTKSTNNTNTRRKKKTREDKREKDSRYNYTDKLLKIFSLFKILYP